jgi:hypothetical protein
VKCLGVITLELKLSSSDSGQVVLEEHATL